ncbi:hypothetical protein F1880_008570 [Penicillium rolfsii]|nr:hypothetical protein F1880_008570 [Penicillium rolfsii]
MAMRGEEHGGQAATVRPSGDISNGAISALFSVISKKIDLAQIHRVAPRATNPGPDRNDC